MDLHYFGVCSTFRHSFGSVLQYSSDIHTLGYSSAMWVLELLLKTYNQKMFENDAAEHH